jgi:hypothetical protein
MLGVLLAAGAGQRRPAAVECLDLLGGALWMRVRPRVPRSNRAAVAAAKLMYLGAVVESTTRRAQRSRVKRQVAPTAVLIVQAL